MTSASSETSAGSPVAPGTHRLSLVVQDAELGLARVINMIRRRGFHIVSIEAHEESADPRIARPMRIEATLRGTRSIEWLRRLLQNQPGFTVEHLE